MVKILIVRLTSLGDIIHTFPMIYDIKQNVKDCQIDWLVDSSFADIVKFNHHINQTIAIPLRKWKKNKLFAIFSLIKWKRSLSNITYDYIIDSQGLIKSASLSKLFKGTVHGLDQKSIKEKLASKFYKHVYETGDHPLATNKNRVLASKIFSYDVDLTKTCFDLNFIASCPNNNLKRYVMFFYATSKPSKQYSLNNWVTLADYLIKTYDLNVILPFGNNSEKMIATAIKQKVNSENIIIYDHVLSYNEIGNLIHDAFFIFGVDTGLTHLANALGKNIIAIYVDTNPLKTGIVESSIAKNIGGENNIPYVSNIIDLFEVLKKDVAHVENN